jgi:hypothetical protein
MKILDRFRSSPPPAAPDPNTPEAQEPNLAELAPDQRALIAQHDGPLSVATNASTEELGEEWPDAVD